MSLFGHSLSITLAPTHTWLRLGPLWALLAGVLVSRPDTINMTVISITVILPVLAAWVLVDPVWGTLWEISAQQGLWRQFRVEQLPTPKPNGFSLPYAQPGSSGGALALKVRRYQAWWQSHFWPNHQTQLWTFVLGAGLALLISLLLNLIIFWITLLALLLIVVAGQSQPDLTSPTGGRLQSLVQFLLPWTIGVLLWQALTPLSLLGGVCFWVTYLGALRLLGGHQRAELLLFMGQLTAIVLLAASQAWLGAIILGLLLIRQFLLFRKIENTTTFLNRVQFYLIVGLLVLGYTLGK